MKQAARDAARIVQAAPTTPKKPPVKPAPPVARSRPRLSPAPAGGGRRRSSSARSSSRLPAGCTAGTAIALAGSRRFLLYTPPGRRPAGMGNGRPLVVMLHGCGQDAAGFALSTRMNRVAARAGFLVLYPEQDRLHHVQGCWSWYAQRSGRAKAEAAIILAAIDQVCRHHGADPAAVSVVGLSAGAGMAALLGVRHPDRFRAVVMHSGVAPGAAVSAATALEAMHGRRQPAPLARPAGSVELPPLLVIQGDADRVVAPVNGRAAARLWAEAAGAPAAAPRIVARGARRPMTVTDHRVRGRLVARLCEVEGLGHAWSGGDGRRPFGDPAGPDASAMAWAFIARRGRAA